MAEKAEQEAAAGQWGSLSYRTLYKSNIYLAGLFNNGDWKTRWSLQAGDERSKFKTILCFGGGTALTWRKSEELMLNYLDLSHLSRLKNYAGSQSCYLMSFYVKRWQDFRYTGKLQICTSSGVWSLHSLPALSSSTWICSPCQLLRRHIPGTSRELHSHREVRRYTTLNQHQSASYYWCGRKAHSTNIPSKEWSLIMNTALIPILSTET